MNKLKLALMGSVITLFLAGCNIEPLEADVEDTIENGGAYKTEEESKSLVDLKDDVNQDLNKDDKKESEDLRILSTYKMESETLHFDKDLYEIIEKVHYVGGYVSSNEIKTNNSEKETLKESKLTIRVPKDKTPEVINVINKKLTITSELLTSVDITENYYDIESRIENIEAREERLKILYKKSNDVNEIIKIDEKLSEITKEKEELARKKIKMEDRSSFSRIDINVKEVKKISVVEKENLSSSEKIKKTFATTGGNIKAVAVGIFVFLIGAFPLLLVLAVGIFSYKKIMKIVEEKKLIKKEEKIEPENVEEIEDLNKNNE